MSCHRHVWRTSPSAVLSDVFRWGRRYRVHKLMLLIQTYEKPCIKRTRIAEENAYYPRWFYLKYATEVIKYSFRNHLRLASPLDPLDEQRLPSFAGLRAPTAAERAALLANVEAQLAAVHKEILRMDSVNVITNAPKEGAAAGAAAAEQAGRPAAEAAQAQPLHVTAADLLRDTEARLQGVLPSLPVFLRRHQERLSSSSNAEKQQEGGQQQQQHWSKDELTVLYYKLRKYVSLCKQMQQLRETLMLQYGQAATATWTRSLSDEQMHAELFSSSLPSRNSSERHRQNTRNHPRDTSSSSATKKQQ